MAGQPKSREEIPGWMLWLAEHGFAAVMSLGLCLLLIIGVIGYWLDNRLGQLEDRISQKPPKSYQPPDLEQLAATDFDDTQIVSEHLVYVPIYSHVYYGGGRPFLLEATLSIRNRSPIAPAYVRSVRYYNTDGELVNQPVDRLIRLAPLQTLEFVVSERDSRGGSGANYLVEWV
ncbi:MAG: DUF3124 domain-containing protein, partial [Planctomycetota bacterium]